MPLKRSIYLMFLLAGTFLQQGLSQYYTPIGGDTLNRYTAIDTIYTWQSNNVDSVVVTSLAGFGIGDTVMVYCTQGAAIDMTNGRIDDEDSFNQGRYAFLLIDSIIPSRKLIIFNNWMPMINPLNNGESAQLIRVHSFRRARVTSELTVPNWNPVTRTGGVLALFVQRTLQLDEDINLTGKGFRGAQESVNYDGTCAITNPSDFDSLFYKTNSPQIRAGLKGEGITFSSFAYKRGKGRNINGGGGGNARLSGGGGGSNYRYGGKGGCESTLCDPVPGLEMGGEGGYSMSAYGYINEGSGTPIFEQRAFLGGGGGSGTRISGRTTSIGGNGGGLVVILADSILGNGNSIISDGASVSTAVSGAGGGGGGGGAILLDVNGYKDLQLSAVGGDGGNVNHASEITGPGGGGGGGAYWVAGSVVPAGVDMDRTSQGQAGRYLLTSAEYHCALDGTPAGRVLGLRVPLQGFLFNTVPDQYESCSDVTPNPIFAGLPRGGLGPVSYAYEWLDSTENHSWQPATYGTYSAQDFQFLAPLTETTWYRRKVTSGALEDISFRIEVTVHPFITGNVISAPDTVCYNGIPERFSHAGNLSGGIPAEDWYSYRWLSRTDGSGYAPIPGATDSIYQAGQLTETTYFVREVQSGACVSTSDSMLVKVWPTLTGNDIGNPDSVCYNTAPNLITGERPENGDQADIRYRWQSAVDTVSGWALISGAQSRSYQAGPLTATTYFRRLVLSGSGDACKDTSNHVEIFNVPLITGNTILGDQTVCTNDTASLLTGTDPGGGYQGLYSYQWQSRTLSSGWGAASGVIDLKTGYEPGQMTGDTTWYRRAVGSGGPLLNVCVDYSDSVAVNVLPLITGNRITAPDTVLCEGDTVGLITQDLTAGSEPGGGATQGGVDPTRRYQWERSTGFGQPGSWEVIPGEDQLNYSGRPPADGEEDRFFRRIVYSGPEEQCMDISTLKITVHTGISGNTIDPFDSVCFAGTKELRGGTPSGEPGLTPVYTWRDADAGTDFPGSDQEDFTPPDPFTTLGQYHFTRQAVIGSCLSTSNEMEVTIMQLPGGRLTDDAFKACEGDAELNIELNINNLSIFASPWEITFRNQVNSGIGPVPVTGDGPVPVTLDIDTDSLELNFEIESIRYSWEEGYECVSPADSLGGVVPVYVYRTPAPQINSPVSPYSVCGTTMTLTASSDRGTGSWSSIPSGTVLFTPGTLEEEFLASIPDTHESYGEYQLIFTSVAGICPGTAVLDARFDEQPDTPDPGPDTMVYLRDSYEMRAEPPTAGIGTWTVDQSSVSIADPNDPHSLVSNLETGKETTFTWTVTNGVCQDVSEFVIVFRNELKRYEGFSPNGDLQNEYFIMRGLAYADAFNISFFNGLGDLVRTVTNETVGELRVDESLVNKGLQEDELVVWDGYSNNGNLVPSGTYYYVISFTYQQKTYPNMKGYVVVMRE